MTSRDINIFIDKKYTELIDTNENNDYIQYLPFYENIEKKELQYLFSYFQYRLNYLLKFMNDKFSSNRHYNAGESRELIETIDDVKKIIKIVKEYKINDNYLKTIERCNIFLSSSGGSAIPEDFNKLEIIDYEAIFKSTTTIKTNISDNHYQLKPIGSGSYAEVFKYKDTYYNKKFVLKKAKKGLNDKELERFKLEFISMQKLNSPYILEVYTFDEDKNHYIMEYADTTLYDYIDTNNTKITSLQRKIIVNQIFKAFKYIHDTLGLHRDISSTNILLKLYHDTIVIKVSDFGLVKIKDSNLTSDNTEFKGSLNDPQLNIVGGFKKYSIEHETYALTRLIYFIMTGRKIIDKFSNVEFERYINKGISSVLLNRYKSVDEMRQEFNTIKFQN